MKRFLVGADRGQSTLLPECLDEWIDESNPVRAVDAFVDALDLAELGFDGVVPEVTGRPSYHPSALLKLYIYGYLNECNRADGWSARRVAILEVIWLLGRLVPMTRPSPISARRTGLRSARFAPGSPTKRGSFCRPTGSMPSPIVATSTELRSWLEIALGSP